MAKREAALSGGDGGIVSIATCKDLGHKRIELSVVASKAKQSNSIESFMIIGFLACCLPRSLHSLAMTQEHVIASERRERGKQRATKHKENPNTFDCHEASASRNDNKI